MVEGSTNSQVQNTDELVFAAFPRHFFIASLTSRVGLAFWKSCDLGFSESGKACGQEKQNLTCITKES